MQPLISIIIPVYKIEKFIDKCIKSIISQTYRNLEIILVDDGSPDKCPSICDKYAKIDNRIKVIHKPNGGLSDARNAGIDICKGDYIGFVDGDDYISENMYEHLLDHCIKCNADMSICGIYAIDEDYSNLSIYNPMIYKETILSNIQALNHLFLTFDVNFEVAWNKLYKRNLFFNKDNIRYPYGKLHEDTYTTYKLLYYANNIAVFNEPLYYYVQRSGSIMKRIPSVSQIMDRAVSANETISFIKNNNIPLIQEVTAYAARRYSSSLDLLIKNPKLDKAAYKNLRNMLLDLETYLKNNKYISKKFIIKFYLIKSGLYPLYKKLISIIR